MPRAAVWGAGSFFPKLPLARVPPHHSCSPPNNTSQLLSPPLYSNTQLCKPRSPSNQAPALRKRNNWSIWLHSGMHSRASSPPLLHHSQPPPSLQEMKNLMLTLAVMYRKQRTSLLLATFFGGAALFVGFKFRTMMTQSEAGKKARENNGGRVNYSVAPGRSGGGI